MNVNELGHTIRPADVYGYTVGDGYCPIGFEFTGEFRPPLRGETYLGHGWVICEAAHPKLNYEPRLILRPKPRKTRIIFEPTGETRRPKRGEWFVHHNNILEQAIVDFICNEHPIYTPRTEEYTD